MRRTFLFFVYSTANIVGCILGLIGLIAFFTGIIKAYWYVIVPGLYAIGFLFTPKPATFSHASGRELSAHDLKIMLDDLINKIRKRVAQPELNKVVQIKENILMLLPRLDEMNAGDYDLHVIRQTVADYLPEMLTTYLELPPAFAKMHRMRNGKTPQEVLIEQLTVLDEQIQRIVVNVNSKDAEALLAQGEFLKGKFAGSDDWL